MNITITESAREQIVKAMDESEFKSPALRLIYAGAGWGGPRLGLALDESENSQDYTFENNNINILLDQNIKRIVEMGRSITIDFHESRFGSGFTIDTGLSC